VINYWAVGRKVNLLELVYRLESVKSMQKITFGWFIKLASHQLSDCLEIMPATCHHQNAVWWNLIMLIHIYKQDSATCIRFIYCVTLNYFSAWRWTITRSGWVILCISMLITCLKSEKLVKLIFFVSLSMIVLCIYGQVRFFVNSEHALISRAKICMQLKNG